MPSASDYSIILGATVKTPGLPNHLKFTLPKSVILSRRSVVSLTLKIVGTPIHFHYNINGKPSMKYALPDGWFGPLTKVIPGRTLRHGENKMNFKWGFVGATDSLYGEGA